MPRVLNKLTDRAVRTAPGPDRISDGGGLYLVIDGSGARRWIFKFRMGGKEREAGFGGFPVVGLAEARRRRDDARQQIAAGRDPIAEKRKEQAAERAAVTFGDFVDTLVPQLVKGFKNEKHRDQWANSLRDHAGLLRSKPIADISTDDVLEVLRPIWLTKSETASRVRGRIERVLDAARASGLRSGDNPARWRGHLDHLLAKRRKLSARGHHKALPYGAVPTFMAELRTRRAISAKALEFLILTAARTSEVTDARWEEINRDDQVWTVPAQRMKGERDHRVPLGGRAMAILDEMSEIRRGDFVFPSFRAHTPMSNGAFDALLGRMKIDATTHGFRSSFRDWAGDETSAQREVIEAALAHAVGDETERAYRRGDALAKRRSLMEAWAKFIGPDAIVDGREKAA